VSWRKGKGREDERRGGKGMEKIEGRGGRMIEKGEEGRERYVMYGIILD